MLNDIVDYMKDEGIEITDTNYRLELLNFIAEHRLNDLDNEKYLDEAVSILSNDTRGENMLVNKCEGRGVTQIEMTKAEVLQLICENITHDEDELTGGVEELEKGVIGIMIHEQLQYEFNVADVKSK